MSQAENEADRCMLEEAWKARCLPREADNDEAEGAPYEADEETLGWDDVTM